MTNIRAYNNAMKNTSILYMYIRYRYIFVDNILSCALIILRTFDVKLISKNCVKPMENMYEKNVSFISTSYNAVKLIRNARLFMLY